MTKDDLAYYERRRDDERRRATESPDAAIAIVHRQMAERYQHAIAARVPTRTAEAVP